MSLLNIISARKEFMRNNISFVAVKDTNLEINSGDLMCIAGKSGSGKTTLINMAAGLLPPTYGAVIFNNIDIYSMKDSEISAFRNRSIGYVPQSAGLMPNFTVEDNIRLPFFLNNVNEEITGRAAYLLSQMGIAYLANQYPQELSGGELRRVAIARALACRPDIIIADEPTGDLDAATTSEIMALFKEINRNGTTVLFVTHDLDTVSYCNRVCVMRAGGLTEIQGEHKKEKAIQLITGYS